MRSGKVSWCWWISACRRDKVQGIVIASYLSLKHYTCSYYNITNFIGFAPSHGERQLHYRNYRYHYRHRWSKRALTESLPQIQKIDEEERSSVQKRLASEHDFTELSV